MTINFVGDLILGDQPVKFGYGFDSIHSKNHYSKILNGVSDEFGMADYNVANFEAVIGERNTKKTISNWSMCCDESVIGVLRNSGINILNVANNHTMDYGADIFNSTIKTIKSAGISIIGLKDSPYVITKKGQECVAIIGVSYLKVRTKNVGYFYNPSEAEWNKVICELHAKGVKKSILYIHWGAEFIPKPSKNQVEILESLLKYKFDAIIGHHPHILQTYVNYKNTPIFFSLGNFISDYWQERARKTFILNVDTTNSLFNLTNCHLDSKGIPTIISKELNVEIPQTEEIQISDEEEIHRQRTILRKEYICEFLKHGYRIREKKAYINWVISRLIYLIKYSHIERKNPEIVYEKYKA